MTDRYLAGVATLRLPEEAPPPAKTKILLLSPYGILSIGPWDSWFLAWAPLPKIPPHIKNRMRLKHGSNKRTSREAKDQGDSEEA